MYSTRAESGEKLPKGVTSSDKTGMKKGSEAGPNSTKGTKGMSGEKLPAGATSSDTSGERKAKIVGGVAMGSADGIGSRDKSHMGKTDGLCGEMKGHMGEKVVYDHKRVGHDQD